MRQDCCAVFLSSPLQSQESLRALAADPKEEDDMRQLAREEAEQGEGDREGLLQAVLKCILPKDEADQRGCILEVRAGKPLAATLHHALGFCNPLYLFVMLPMPHGIQYNVSALSSPCCPWCRHWGRRGITVCYGPL